MTASRIRATCVLVLSLPVAALAVAQEDNEAINADLDWHWFMMEGYDLLGESHWGWLYNGQQESFEIYLDLGDYGVVGACDEDCKDVDLVVTGMTEIGSDREMDDVPYVLFEVTSAGYFTITVEMASCSVQPCAWGVEVYRGM